ncbi:PDZ domain-containing protein [Geomonas sp. RF6]|uniref:S41 family peptidase n=1 Tax=Geomonas sp. RF6 TaxID=2897342 RepID=UPI001E2FB927|nr:PDZ domain-containing protein [Geomonas sp. RF6]UFS68670.1 PDZ domain-containing protein [Geomonas sp. RF6]
MMRLISILFVLLLALAHAGWCANSSSNFGGVGIDGVPLPDGRIAVRQLVAGGPADLAGIRPGDIITHIDGKATAGSNFQQMVATRLRGKAGTQVRLKVRRPGTPDPLSFTLTRRQLVIPHK